LEQRIRDLCLRLIATDESREFEALAQELRDALHAHIEELRFDADRLALVNQLLLSLEPPLG
jgi:predicted Zn-dependent peptidase